MKNKWKIVNGQDRFEFLEFMGGCQNGFTVLDGAQSGPFGGLFVPSCMELSGEMDLNKLESATQIVYDKVDNSRIVIVEEDGKQYFKILEKYEYKLNPIRFPEKSLLKRKKAALADINKFNNEGPKIHNEIAMYIRVYEINKDAYILSLFINHSAGDGYAASMIMRMILAFYNDPDNKNFENLTTFEEYYRDELKKMTNETNREYWRKEIEGISPIPFREDSLPNTSALLNDNYYVILPSKLINKIASDNRATAFNVITLATHLAIHAVYGIDDSCITVASGNRMSKKELRTVAMITTMLSNRLKISDDLKLCELLVASKRKFLENLKHRDAPIEASGLTRVILTYMSIGSTLALTKDDSLPDFDYAPFSPSPTIEGIDKSFLLLVGLEQDGATVITLQCCKKYFLNEDLLNFKMAFEDLVFFMSENPDATVAEYLDYVRSGKHNRGLKYRVFCETVKKMLKS